MVVAFRAFPSLGVVSIFTEAAGGGDPISPSALRNAPAASPETNLDKVMFHTALDNMEVVSDTTVTVSHALVAAASAPAIADPSAIIGFNAGAVDRVLVTHSLGYLPDCIVSFGAGKNALWPGMPVQTNADGRARYCIPYVTTTQVKLYEWSSASGSSMSALSIDYEVIVFRQPRTASGSKLFDFDPATGIVKMGFDRFSSDRNYLQVVSGGSPFVVMNGRCADLKNGAPRFIRPDGTVYDPVPAALTCRLDSNVSYGSSMAYSGSFASPGAVSVQAP